MEKGIFSLWRIPKGNIKKAERLIKAMRARKKCIKKTAVGEKALFFAFLGGRRRHLSVSFLSTPKASAGKASVIRLIHKI